ncbi:MAG TPA: PH domain-containing protein [Candidatus Saccharimonadales bacterium]
MIQKQEVEQQLKKVHFNLHGWGRSEARELPHILMPDEEIYEVVNGIYEGGFALLVSTNFRVLLIDKKPLNYLTVEDLRFDMINEIDYNHRLFGAHISISAGSKNLKFRSYNQPRLRKLITHVQHCMAEAKQKQSSQQADQSTHLEQINQQLQAYLVAQHQQQQKLQEELEASKAKVAVPEPVKPPKELADYLYAQSLLAAHAAQNKQSVVDAPPAAVQAPEPAKPKQKPAPELDSQSSQMAELYAAGMEEVFGKQPEPQKVEPVEAAQAATNGLHRIKPLISVAGHTLELTPLNIAYSKLPMALRNRKFGRPSFHAHSQASLSGDAETAIPATQ